MKNDNTIHSNGTRWPDRLRWLMRKSRISFLTLLKWTILHKNTHEPAVKLFQLIIIIDLIWASDQCERITAKLNWKKASTTPIILKLFAEQTTRWIKKSSLKATSSLIHFARIGVAPLQLVTPMQAKWIKPVMVKNRALHTCMMFCAAAAACRTGHLLTVSLASLLYRYNLGSASYHLYRGSSCRGGRWGGVTVLTTGSSWPWSWPGYTSGPTTHCSACLSQQTSNLTETRSFSMK